MRDEASPASDRPSRAPTAQHDNGRQKNPADCSAGLSVFQGFPGNQSRLPMMLSSAWNMLMKLR